MAYYIPFIQLVLQDKVIACLKKTHAHRGNTPTKKVNFPYLGSFRPPNRNNFSCFFKSPCQLVVNWQMVHSVEPVSWVSVPVQLKSEGSTHCLVICASDAGRLQPKKALNSFRCLNHCFSVIVHMSVILGIWEWKTNAFFVKVCLSNIYYIVFIVITEDYFCVLEYVCMCVVCTLSLCRMCVVSVEPRRGTLDSLGTGVTVVVSPF